MMNNLRWETMILTKLSTLLRGLAHARFGNLMNSHVAMQLLPYGRTTYVRLHMCRLTIQMIHLLQHMLVASIEWTETLLQQRLWRFFGFECVTPIERRPRWRPKKKPFLSVGEHKGKSVHCGSCVSRDTTRGRAATKNIHAFSKLPIKSLCNYIQEYTTSFKRVLKVSNNIW